MVFPTGSASANREFQRHPHFFESTVVSAAGLLTLIYVAPGMATRLAGSVLMLALLLAWGVARLQPLVKYANSRWPSWLARRPVAAMCLPALALSPVAIGVVARNQGGLSQPALALGMLGAIAAGMPIGAAFWEDRFGRKARLARRRAGRAASGAA